MTKFDFKSIEYKMVDRFTVDFPEQFNISSQSILKIDNPTYCDGKWENIKIVFTDSIHPSTTKSLYDIVDFLETNKSSGKVLFIIRINILNAIGNVIETWAIYVEKVLIINFGELNYESNEIRQQFIVIKPYKCAIVI